MALYAVCHMIREFYRQWAGLEMDPEFFELIGYEVCVVHSFAGLNFG